MESLQDSINSLRARTALIHLTHPAQHTLHGFMPPRIR